VTAAQTARSGAARRAPAKAPNPRPRLRVVDDKRLRAEVRQRRLRVLFVVGFVLAAGLFFLVAAFHAFLVTAQSRIDSLDAKVTEAQATYSETRLKIDRLEAPERIVSEAKRLGMVQPAGVRYLSPTAEQAQAVGALGEDTAGTDDGATGRSWAAVKPYLAERP
jgi:cell division protein FtsL